MKNIAKTIAQTLTGLGAALTMIIGKTMTAAAEGDIKTVQDGVDAVYVNGLPRNLFDVVKQVSVTVLGVVAIISVIMLIYGGIRYIISGGDSKKVTDAKNTVLYAIIGLIICFLSYAIITFVINAITGPAA